MDEDIVERLLREPPHPGVECPICSRAYEQPFDLQGRRVGGHEPGGRLCLASRSRGTVNRDARARKAARR